MRLRILAVGRLKEGPERELCARYAERTLQSGRALGFIGPEIVELPESRATRPADRKSDEAAGLSAKAGDIPRILFDERGTTLDSQGFASRLARAQADGAAGLAMMIGGADGLATTLARPQDLVLSFGAMTFPHQLVRVLVLEQLYRAMTILSGHPYHRA